MSEKKLLKSEKLRLKNDRLRAKGKEPVKGWGKMVHTGFGGLNSGNVKTINAFDNTAFIADQQKNIARENEKSNQ